MKITEITKVISDAISGPIGRDEYIDNDMYKFVGLDDLDKINGVSLRCYRDSDDLWYGLIVKDNNDEKLVGILKLERYSNMWQVRLAQITEPYKSQGFATYLYDHVVMNDHLTIISDITQTEGDLGGSRGLWERLYRNGRYTVCAFNLETNDVIPLKKYSDINDVIYNQQEDVVWMAGPRTAQETITEMITRLNNSNKHRTIQWYGEGVQESQR